MYGKTLLELAIAQNQVMQQDAAGAGEGAEGDDGAEDDQDQNEDDKNQRESSQGFLNRSISSS